MSLRVLFVTREVIVYTLAQKRADTLLYDYDKIVMLTSNETPTRKITGQS